MSKVRLIDANALIDYLGCPEDDRDRAVNQIIDAAPTIDPVRHGRWARDDTFRDLYFCDQCLAGEYRKPKFKYCPDCGAEMDAKED